MILFQQRLAMMSWFVPPIVVPIGIALIVVGCAAFRALS
jgi:hypothetical protein